MGIMSHASRSTTIRKQPWLEQLPGVQVTKRRQDYLELHLQAHLPPNLIVEAALQHGGIISRFEVVEPSLTDIFIELVGTPALPAASTAPRA